MEEQEEQGPVIECRKNGPYVVKNVEKVVDSDGMALGKKQERVLCRCGGSKYKPFCDGSHITNRFDDQSASLSQAKPSEQGQETDHPHAADVESGQDPAEAGIIIAANGPYQVQGAIELKPAELGQQSSQQHYALCRCGGSNNKPFCDGSHRQNGFRDDHLLAIARVDSIREELTRVTIENKELVIVNRTEGLSVFSGVCLHAEALMVEGFIEDNYLTCGRHRWRYDLDTGELDGDPSMHLKKLATTVEKGWLLIEREELDELRELEED